MSNPHIDAALECLDPEGDFCWENSDLANIGARIEAQTQATLALAYEQRTANLIATLNLPTGNISGWTPEMIDDYTKRTDEIATRLGARRHQMSARNIWHTDSRDCPHKNGHVCPGCDFDGYYERTYPDCPWRDNK